MRTPAQLEQHIDKIVGQYKKGMITFEEYMILLKHEATEGVARFAQDDSVLMMTSEGFKEL